MTARLIMVAQRGQLDVIRGALVANHHVFSDGAMGTQWGAFEGFEPLFPKK